MNQSRWIVSLSIGGVVLLLVTMSAGAQGAAPKGGTKKAAAATSAGAAGAVRNPVKATPASISAGRAVFEANCAPCHGADAKGSPSMAMQGVYPPDLTDAEWRHGSKDADIFNVVRNGVGPQFYMAPFKDSLKEKEVWDVINYVRSLSGAKGKH